MRENLLKTNIGIIIKAIVTIGIIDREIKLQIATIEIIDLGIIIKAIVTIEIIDLGIIIKAITINRVSGEYESDYVWRIRYFIEL